MIASAITIIIQIAKKYNTPLFITDTLLFQLGGDYAQGVDYTEQGQEMVESIEAILEKKNNPEEFLVIKKSQSSGLLTR